MATRMKKENVVKVYVAIKIPKVPAVIRKKKENMAIKNKFEFAQVCLKVTL